MARHQRMPTNEAGYTYAVAPHRYQPDCLQAEEESIYSHSTAPNLAVNPSGSYGIGPEGLLPSQSHRSQSRFANQITNQFLSRVGSRYGALLGSLVVLTVGSTHCAVNVPWTTPIQVESR